jgi:hypothetical protein
MGSTSKVFTPSATSTIDPAIPVNAVRINKGLRMLLQSILLMKEKVVFWGDCHSSH